MADCLKNSIDKNCPCLILCEGADAKYFLIQYLIRLKMQIPAFENFRVYDFGGIYDLPKFMKGITLQENFFTYAKSVCVIRDAEGNADAACDAVRHAFNNAGLECPDKPFDVLENTDGIYKSKKTGFVLFPAISQVPKKGMLEDLCLDILKIPDSKRQADRAEKILQEQAKAEGKTPEEKYPRISKNILNMCFAMEDEHVFKKIGEAANAFDFSHPSIEPLRNFFGRLL